MAKDRQDEQEQDDPVVEWLEAQLKLMSARQLGRKYHIDPSVITRNLKNYREGKGLAGTFRTRIEGIIEQEQLERLHRQHLADQAAAAELKRQEDLTRDAVVKERAEREAAEAKEKERAERIAKKAAATARADVARQRREMEDAFILACEDWEARFREAGYLTERQMVEGDAEELILTGISDLDYVDIGVAAVALLPDDYVIWRDKTVKFFREGVSYKARLQPTAIPNGQPRPEMIGSIPTSVVYRDPLPDQLWRYGREGVELISEWRRLTDTYGHLATGRLPWVAHLETVRGFERLIDIEEQSEYVFEDSRLGPDARDRLKALQRRAALPAIGLTTADMTGSASKAAVRWLCSDGWKWAGYAVAALVAIAVVVGAALGFWEVVKWGWGLRTDLWAWGRANGGVLLLGGILLAGTGGVAWWVWPKSRDAAIDVVWRATLVMAVVFAVGVVGIVIAIVVISVAPEVKEIMAAIESYDPYSQTIVIP